jgi:hypothetical protein
MALKPNDSIMAGIGVAAVVVGINAVHLPTVAAASASDQGNMHLDKARSSSSIIAVAVVIGASLLAKDPTVFVIGGTTVVALDFAHRVANSRNKTTGTVPGPGTAAPVTAMAG